MRGELLDDPKTKRKYWRQFYGNGTLCDLTGKPRESEVRVQCAPGEPSYLVSIEEVSTCKYLVQFSSNLLCKHPAFAALKRVALQACIRHILHAVEPSASWNVPAAHLRHDS